MAVAEPTYLYSNLMRENWHQFLDIHYYLRVDADSSSNVFAKELSNNEGAAIFMPF
jgi:hypothetical protein